MPKGTMRPVAFRASIAAASVVLCLLLSDAATSQPLYAAPVRPLDGCEEAFSPALCRDFDFLLQSETASRFEQDRLIIRPTSAYHTSGLVIDACSVAALIRETEALPSPRFIELRFERITIQGPLHLSEIDPRARLSFFDVNFVPAPPTNDAGGDLGIASRSERTMPGASFGQPAPSKRDTRAGTIGASGSEGTISDAAFAQPELPTDGENAAAGAGGGNDRAEPAECLLPEPLDPAFAGSSVVIERSHFRDRVLFERALFEGSVIVSGSTFTSNFDLVQSDVGGDLVLESSEFASSLELGHGTILRGQIVVDGVRVGGDMAIDGIDVIDTYLDAQEIETVSAAPEAARALAPACVCEHRNGSFNVDTDRLDVKRPDLGAVEQACKRLPNLPRCPRSNGFNPFLIEISHTAVAGLFNLTGLALGSKNVAFRPFKSSDRRFAELDKGKTCPFTPGEPLPANCESSLSRFESANILLDDLSVDGAALLRGNQANALYVNHSSIQRLTSEGNEFVSLFVARNEFGNIKSLKDTFYGGFWVTRNNIVGSMELDSVILSDEIFKTTKEPAALSASVTHNYIGRDLAFTPYNLTTGTVDEVDLSTNRVGGELAVSLPAAPAAAPAGTGQANDLTWSGSIRLQSLTVDGTLAIRLAQPAVKSGRVIVDTAGALAQEAFSCAGRDGGRALVHLDLAGTVAKNILWAVPIRKPADCVSWEGVGLRYDSWEAGPGWGDLDPANGALSGAGSEQLSELLHLWRELYARDGRASAPPPDPLHHMANYLGKIGDQKGSREFRAEAKRAGFPLPADDLWATLGNAVAWIVFLPTDFGTKPERAFLVLVGSTLFAWVFYMLCRWCYRRDWPDVRQRRDALLMRDRINEAMLEHLAVQDLEGQGAPIDHERRKEILDRYAPDRGSSLADLTQEELRHISAVPGFLQYDRDRQPQDFMLWRYALDTMVPVIDLHAYNQYYPKPKWMRTFAMLQHVVGWWVLTSFLASLAVF